MKVSELVRILSKNGCNLQHHGSNHDIWYSPITKKTTTVPRHGSQEIRKGTLNSILKRLGIE